MRTFSLTHTHSCPELDYHAFCQCTHENSGNFYDFFPQDSTRLAISFGDLPSAGEPSSLSIPCMQALVRGLTAGRRGDLADLAGELNQTAYLLGSRDLCAPWFYALADPLKRELKYVNAGHVPPLLIRGKGRVERLEPTGAALGLSTHSAPRQRAVTMEPGDILAIFSEALTDSLVLEVVRKHTHAGAAELAKRVLENAPWTPGEDRTFAAVRVVDARREPLPLEYEMELPVVCAA